jgi:hypothetical protein
VQVTCKAYPFKQHHEYSTLGSASLVYNNPQFRERARRGREGVELQALIDVNQQVK